MNTLNSLSKKFGAKHLGHLRQRSSDYDLVLRGGAACSTFPQPDA